MYFQQHAYVLKPSLSTKRTRISCALHSPSLSGTAPTYATKEWDGAYVLERSTFTEGYEVCKLPGLMSKTKEVAFDILNKRYGKTRKHLNQD